MDAASAEKHLQQRLQHVTGELQQLERMVRSGNCSPRILNDFRTAVDNIRQTAWAVQQWTELQNESRDPYTVLDVLSKERVRRATQISRDLRIDLESLELSIDTEGLPELFQAIESLHERLAPLFRKSVV